MNATSIPRAACALLGCFALAGSAVAQCNSAPPIPIESPGGANGASPAPSNPAPGAPDPGSPATPAPTGPSAPAPATPATPNTPRGPSSGALTPRSMPRGMPITLTRGDTSKDRLTIDWVHPVRQDDGVRTRAAGALTLEEALDAMWEDGDDRPLLVLRECNLCQGSDGALLSRSMKNDKTIVLARWFRTVRLPAHVVETGHPFHKVFFGYEWKHVPHFFLLAHKGAEPVPFTGTQTQSQLWRKMASVLEERYTKDPLPQARKLLMLLDRYDSLESRRDDMREQLLAVRAERGPDSARARQLGKALAEIEAEWREVEAEEKEVRDLRLQPSPEALAAARVTQK